MRCSALLSSFLVITNVIARHGFDEHSFAAKDVIQRDVCVIGGGSSGTNAAINLLRAGQSVVVVEKQNRLGGHVNTFKDSVTGLTADLGVVVFDNISAVTDYFSYLDVELGLPSFGSGETKYANFRTGTPVAASVLPQQRAVGAALTAYNKVLDKWPYLNNGFDLPKRIPEDFLITWGEFLKKYKVEAMGYIAWQYLQGAGNILAQPALYMLKYWPQITVDGVLGTSNFLSTANHDNQELYDKALMKLGAGKNAFISSKVTYIARTKSGVAVIVSTPSGKKLIKASKLLISIPPLLSNLQQLGLDLDSQETSVFRQLNNSYYWNCALRKSGIPNNVSLTNIDPAAPLDIPPSPGAYTFSSTRIPGIHFIYYGSPHYLSDSAVKADILATNARLVKAFGFETSGQPEIAEFNSHSPFEVTVSAEAVKNGFYRKANALQGHRNTYWTGAAWQAQDSSIIWNWTEHTLLPKMLADLRS